MSQNEVPFLPWIYLNLRVLLYQKGHLILRHTHIYIYKYLYIYLNIYIYMIFCSILKGVLWPTKTYKVAFWMRKFGSMSFKRTWVWSSSKRICELDMGCLTPSEKKGSLQTTTRYVDRSGKRRFKGNALLKRSQWLVAKFIHILVFPKLCNISSQIEPLIFDAQMISSKCVC